LTAARTAGSYGIDAAAGGKIATGHEQYRQTLPAAVGGDTAGDAHITGSNDCRAGRDRAHIDGAANDYYIGGAAQRERIAAENGRSGRDLLHKAVGATTEEDGIEINIKEWGG